jgi:hypothetical protein
MAPSTRFLPPCSTYRNSQVTLFKKSVSEEIETRRDGRKQIENRSFLSDYASLE